MSTITHLLDAICVDPFEGGRAGASEFDAVPLTKLMDDAEREPRRSEGVHIYFEVCNGAAGCARRGSELQRGGRGGGGGKRSRPKRQWRRRRQRHFSNLSSASSSDEALAPRRVVHPRAVALHKRPSASDGESDESPPVLADDMRAGVEFERDPSTSPSRSTGSIADLHDSTASSTQDEARLGAAAAPQQLLHVFRCAATRIALPVEKLSRITITRYSIETATSVVANAFRDYLLIFYKFWNFGRTLHETFKAEVHASYARRGLTHADLDRWLDSKIDEYQRLRQTLFLLSGTIRNMYGAILV